MVEMMIQNVDFLYYCMSHQFFYISLSTVDNRLLVAVYIYIRKSTFIFWNSCRVRPNL